MSRYAVFGHPIAHSLSPRIHAQFGKQRDITVDYTTIDAAPAEFVEALEQFARQGGVGANVTLPNKETAYTLCSQLSERAQRAGAANMLTRVDGEWHGDNTDGVALIRDLTGRHGQDLRARRTLLLGAGGAAHGVAPALLDAGISELIIVNRTPERADVLADKLGLPRRAHTRYWDDLGTQGDFELIINATSASRGGSAAFDLPFSLTNSRTLAVDLNYGEASIPFLAWARAAGCHATVDGLGMLVEQAAESFRLWHGERPDTDPAYAMLREISPLLVTVD